MNDKISYQTELLANRLSKKYKSLRKWARKNRVSCYRLYDRDIPEIPLCIDLYELLPETADNKIDAARFIAAQNQMESENNQEAVLSRLSRSYIEFFLYERPYEKDPAEEANWLNAMAEKTAVTLGIEKRHVIIKNRRHDKGGSQYSKDDRTSESHLEGLTQEKGQIFKLNLTDYLDTGLFLDHRPLRAMIRNQCRNKKVLNLFCYTGSFSVFAAEGGACLVDSVDLSNTYLSWTKENMDANGFSDEGKYRFIRADVMQFLQDIKDKTEYDIIILDPPTFSNSKKTQNTLDINRDWLSLVKGCLSVLNPEGILYFSTNSRKLAFEQEKIQTESGSRTPVLIQEITESTIDEDFKNTKPHRCWKITKPHFF